MRATFVRSVLLVACFLASTVGMAANGQEKILIRAAQLFGEPLNAEHRVYQLNGNYVIWLIFDTQGELFEVDVGPKSYYSAEFPSAPLATKADRLSKAEYEETLRKISQLKDIGALLKGHESAVSSDFGPLNTDQFEGAFVDRVVADDGEEEVKKFNLYFFQDEFGSPEQVKTVQGQPMVCSVGVWYYVKPETESKITLGQWQRLQAAGPNLHGTTGCFRTTILHDADGFTIEEPQNAIIVVAEPYRVRVLEGRVTIADQPVQGANVEVLPVGGQGILRSKTDEEGTFRIPDAAEGEYKFKVTKDGFKALSGKIIVDHSAPPEPLSFGMYVGT
jgi:Carboxypeptidase regulatory-like domain